jgi:hypothetical protein
MAPVGVLTLNQQLLAETGRGAGGCLQRTVGCIGRHPCRDMIADLEGTDAARNLWTGPHSQEYGDSTGDHNADVWRVDGGMASQRSYWSSGPAGLVPRSCVIRVTVAVNVAGPA